MLPAHNAELGVKADLLRPPLLVPLIVVCKGSLSECVHVRHFKDLGEQVLFLARELQGYLFSLLIGFLLFESVLGILREFQIS